MREDHEQTSGEVLSSPNYRLKATIVTMITVLIVLSPIGFFFYNKYTTRQEIHFVVDSINIDEVVFNEVIDNGCTLGSRGLLGRYIYCDYAAKKVFSTKTETVTKDLQAVHDQLINLDYNKPTKMLTSAGLQSIIFSSIDDTEDLPHGFGALYYHKPDHPDVELFYITPEADFSELSVQNLLNDTPYPDKESLIGINTSRRYFDLSI